MQEKIEKMSTSEGRNPNLDIVCQYLGFLEEDNDNYNYIIKRFEEGKDDKSEVKNKVLSLFKEILNTFKEKDIKLISIKL